VDWCKHIGVNCRAKREMRYAKGITSRGR